MRINFSNPFNGRKWLSLLKPSKRYGLSFDKEVVLNDKFLNFSFSTNEFGLRGISNPNASTVICGTSYAMGLSVNIGENWYDLISKEGLNFMNIGFPVGTENHNNRLEDLYKGDFSKLIFIYHPNNWITSYNFYLAGNQSQDIFEFMGWKTKLLDVIKIYPKWMIKQFVKRIKKRNIYYKLNRRRYFLNTNYSYIDLNTKENFVIHEVNQLNKLFSLFKDVILVRVPIKEQILSSKINNFNLERLNQNYECNYDLFKKNINHDSVTEIDMLTFFEIEDYHPYDTHWNKNGNEVFYNEIRRFF